MARGNARTLCGAIALAMATPLCAQGVGADGRAIYAASFFSQFAPANALQIVQRVPGFSIEDVDEEVRGFGQAAGNVVINGQRPSTKSEDLDDVLARIPATRVLRVEVAAGDKFGAEYTGKAQVLNLVLRTEGGLAGTVDGTLRRSFTGKLYPEGSASALLRRGQSTFNLSATVDNDYMTEEGFDRLTDLPGGAQREYRRKINYIRQPNGGVTLNWEHNGGTNRIAHLNGRFGFDRLSLTQYNDVTPAVGPVRDDYLTQRYRRRDFELGGDVTRPFLGGGLKLIGLATRRHRNNDDVSLLRVQSDLVDGFTQDLVDDREETVARLLWTRSNLGGWNIETGVEGALNRLDSDVRLSDLDTDGNETRIDLPIDQAVVKELRGEAFVTLGRPLSSTLRTDFGLTYEASRLTVRGDATSTRNLSFLKPRITLDWRNKAGLHVQLSAKRTVAQLQFEDFISAAELANERVNGGNANLVPQRAWELLGTMERPILGSGLVKVELGYNRISLLQDRVPTPEGFDAPGNIGTGDQVIARTKIDAPLGRFGIKGGRLTLYGSYVRGWVEDPYTLRLRRFSGNSSFFYEVNFRQDLGKFAWGVNAVGWTDETFYRRNELDTFSQRNPWIDAFAEYRHDPRTTFTLGVENLTDAASYRDRLFFAPDRRTALPNLLEHRQRNRHVMPYISVKRTFG